VWSFLFVEHRRRRPTFANQLTSITENRDGRKRVHRVGRIDRPVSDYMEIACRNIGPANPPR
jgi:hypothetical protein